MPTLRFARAPAAGCETSRHIALSVCTDGDGKGVGEIDDGVLDGGEYAENVLDGAVYITEEKR